VQVAHLSKTGFVFPEKQGQGTSQLKSETNFRSELEQVTHGSKSSSLCTRARNFSLKLGLSQVYELVVGKQAEYIGLTKEFRAKAVYERSNELSYGPFSSIEFCQ
jgi:hypothetical protein